MQRQTREHKSDGDNPQQAAQHLHRTKHCETREMSFRPELPTLMVAGVQIGGTPVQRHDARSISSQVASMIKTSCWVLFSSVCPMRKTRSNIVEHSHGHIPAAVLRTGALSHGLIGVASKVSAPPRVLASTMIGRSRC